MSSYRPMRPQDVYRFRDTPSGRVPVDMDGNPLSAEEWAILQEELAQKEARRREVHERAAAERAAADEARRQQRADPGGVPWTKTEMEAGLSGAPRSNIPMDAELTVTNSGPKPVDISSVAPDHGLTKVDSGDIERDPKTGKAKRGGAWAVAAPRPIKDFIVDENDEQGIQQFEEFADAQQDPNARRRKDLERAGYQAVRKQRPDGSEVWVYSTRDQDSPVDSERRDMARRGVSLDGTPGRQMSEGMSGGTEFQRRQRIQRMADKLGVTPAEVRKMMTEGGELGRGETPNASQIGYNSFAAFDPVRERLATQRGAEKKAKAEEAQAAVVRNAQWRQNLQEWFKNPTVTDEQRQFASAILLRRGATPNDIDAAQAEGVQRGIALGARQNINVTDQDMAREAWRQKQREADPAAAGASDIASGRPDSPQGIVEVERLADEIDDTTFGFSYENERALAIRLQQPPYNMKKPEAEAAANRAANKRRWYSTSQADAQNNAGGQPTPPPAAGGRQPGGEPIIPGAWFPL